MHFQVADSVVSCMMLCAAAIDDIWNHISHGLCSLVWRWPFIHYKICSQSDTRTYCHAFVSADANALFDGTVL